MPRRKGQWVCKRKDCRKSNMEMAEYCRRCGYHRIRYFLGERDLNKIDYAE